MFASVCARLFVSVLARVNVRVCVCARSGVCQFVSVRACVSVRLCVCIVCQCAVFMNCSDVLMFALSQAT